MRLTALYFRTRRLVIALSTTACAVRLLRGRREVLLAEVLPAESPDGDWRAAVSALKAWLLAREVTGCAVNVLLCHRLIRSSVVPWSDDLLAESSAQSYLREHFADRFGATTDDWTHVVAEGGRQQPRFACGVNHDLIRALQALAVDCRLKLNSIAPLLTAVVNQYRKKCPEDGWLGVAEPGKLALIFFREGNAVEVSFHSHEVLSPESLQLLIRRARLRNGAPADLPVRIFDSECRDISWPVDVALNPSPVTPSSIWPMPVVEAFA